MEERIKVVRVLRVDKDSGGLRGRSRVEFRRGLFKFRWCFHQDCQAKVAGEVPGYIVRDVTDEDEAKWEIIFIFVACNDHQAELNTATGEALKLLDEAGEVESSRKTKIVHHNRSELLAPIYDALIAAGLLPDRVALRRQLVALGKRRKARRRREEEAQLQAARERRIRQTEAALSELKADGVLNDFEHTLTPSGSLCFRVTLSEGQTIEVIVKGQSESARRYRRAHPGSLVVAAGGGGGVNLKNLKRRIARVLAEAERRNGTCA